MDALDRKQDASNVHQWWTSAPQLDENTLRDGILDLLNKIHEAALYDDWDAVQEHIQLYQLGETYCAEEPQLSTYEYGKMGIDCTVAGNHLNLGEYAKAAEKLAAIFETYNARMERYRLQGVPPRRASEVRYRFLLYLADLKWIAPEEWKNTVLTPDQVLDDLGETTQNILSFLKSNPGSHSNEQSLLEGTALAELVGCKMALRYCPGRVPDLVRHFNERHSEHLAIPVGNYQSTNAARSGRSAYYWDFELAKLRMGPSPPLQDIYMCIELRALAAHNTFGDWTVQGLLRGWRREALVIVRELQSQQET